MHPQAQPLVQPHQLPSSASSPSTKGHSGHLADHPPLIASTISHVRQDPAPRLPGARPGAASGMQPDVSADTRPRPATRRPRSPSRARRASRVRARARAMARAPRRRRRSSRWSAGVNCRGLRCVVAFVAAGHLEEPAFVTLVAVAREAIVSD
jgi:hypothetical protein